MLLQTGNPTSTYKGNAFFNSRRAAQTLPFAYRHKLLYNLPKRLPKPKMAAHINAGKRVLLSIAEPSEVVTKHLRIPRFVFPTVFFSLSFYDS
ncbi:Hypothetical protein HDN1F_10990 [gamma proteobacterium HdN1]|nr:Hypothetical protein HDN1F_10990 [gamma proteobacterium HdN1]